MKYYCTHHPVLTERKKYLDAQFTKLNMDVTWVTGGDPSELKMPEGHRFSNINEYSSYIKHAYCIEDQVQYGYDLITVFEDDVLLPDDYLQLESVFLKEFKELDGDIMFQGTCCNIYPDYSDLKPDKHVYCKPGYLSRCAHCFTVTLRAAEKMEPYLYKDYIVYDFKLNEIIKAENLKTCYTVPSIYQGTETKLFKSTLR